MVSAAAGAGGFEVEIFFFAEFAPQFTIGREQSPVSYGKAFLLFLRHNRSFFDYLNISVNGKFATVAALPPASTRLPGVAASRRI